MPTLRPNNTFSDLVHNAICSLPHEITSEEAKFFNAFPISDVIPVLQQLAENFDGPVAIHDRAIDALLKLDEFDGIGYLFEKYDNEPSQWGWTITEELPRFPEPRVIKKLCEIAEKDDDPDIRFRAVFALSEIGDASIIPTLEHVQKYDRGQSYEEEKIADLASKILKEMHAKSNL